MVELTKQQYIDLYYYMRLTRSLEERLTILFRQNKVIGGLYRSLGQEATAVGTAYALSKGDILSPLIRDLGAMLVRGALPREIFMQYMAREGGGSRGRDLNIHIADLERGFIGPISHLGDMVSVTAGLALGARLKAKNIVTMVYVGDGATSTGAFHEGVNLIAVLNLPTIIVMEHNGYAFSTPTEQQCAVRDLIEKAKAYGIPGYIVDGNDVVACYEVARQAVDRARQGGGPTMIEAKTFRMLGHAQHDDQRYVPKDLLEYWKTKDPIDNYKRVLEQKDILKSDELDQLDRRIAEYLDEELAIAEASPFPDPASLLEGVYKEPIRNASSHLP
ncbi:MAG: thiamine pyrophosphate-dependent dehydrogenase E1 component subunit alpha [Acidobacteriota bacterium]|nr:thiamine pyrophosphate-dependent dehydrogenase E1 component subunit alpha [Blastocatellia bacterium]MDW8411529.1 thiamine pyrophosphate-dependent dehydrogenase E1 component subunit alpha [Acidobacteriota bacterium]